MTTTEQSYETAPALIGTLRRYQHIASFAGLVGLALLIVGFFTSGAQQFLRSYLVGFWMWFGAGAGCLLMLMTQYLTGGAWGIMIRKPLEAGAKTLYLFVLGFLPLLLGHESIYWWTTKEGQADAMIQAKHLYLNMPFMWIRYVIYALFLVTVTYFLLKWSRQEAETKSTVFSAKLEKLSAPGVPILFLLMTWCSIDYLMVLEPHWYSTVYGFMCIIGWCFSALAIAVAILGVLAQFEPFSHALTKKHLHDLGKLLLAVTMLWAYLQFSQLLITWSGNLPEEIIWYIKRWNGGWGWVGLIVLIGHFCLPFLLLLWQPIKKNLRTITAVAIYMVIVHAVDVFSLIEPNFAKRIVDIHFSISVLDVLAPIGFGGLWLAMFFRNLQTMPLLPTGAPDLQKALNHGKSH
ncbi:MAG TPA: hypothetical protein VN519_03935 [Bryobacteraceae bacterium]|nr:hypothetical protein [Bryobacteraceae bacterium]